MCVLCVVSCDELDYIPDLDDIDDSQNADDSENAGDLGGEEHTHVFDKEVASAEYLKSAATETAPALYYFSCECGEKGEDAFSYGDVAAHEHFFPVKWYSNEEKHWHECLDADCDAVNGEAKNTFTSWTTAEEATCSKNGVNSRSCSVCGYTEEKSISMKTHVYAEEWSMDENYHWLKCQNDACTSVAGKGIHEMVNGSCKICGCKKYTRKGDYIYFGEYPQSIWVSGSSITSTKDSRGYYLGTDGSYYAKVAATPYATGYKFSSGETISHAVYYFKVEPIRWRILYEDGEKALIVCDSIIDAMPFGKKGNSYAYSTVRYWLNSDFYSIAFTDIQRKLICATLLDNSDNLKGSDSEEPFSASTNDQIFLLSCTEVCKAEYGFAPAGTDDAARRLLTSDFARAKGVYMMTESGYYGVGTWWLRSYGFTSSQVCRVGPGYVGGSEPNYQAGGVVPALWISLK